MASDTCWVIRFPTKEQFLYEPAPRECGGGNLSKVMRNVSRSIESGVRIAATLDLTLLSIDCSLGYFLAKSDKKANDPIRGG